MPENEETTTKQPEQTDAAETTDTQVENSQSQTEHVTEPASNNGCGTVIALPIIVLLAMLGSALVVNKE